MWLKGAIVDVGLDAASVDVLCIMLNLDYDKTVSTNQLRHWRKRLLASSKHNSEKPRLLLSYSDHRTKVSRLSNMLPRVADLIIRETPVKLNLRFEELASIVSGQSSADGAGADDGGVGAERTQGPNKKRKATAPRARHMGCPWCSEALCDPEGVIVHQALEHADADEVLRRLGAAAASRHAEAALLLGLENTRKRRDDTTHPLVCKIINTFTI